MSDSKIPALEERFLQPPGWRWGYFTRAGRKLRFGAVMPKDKIPDAVVVCLPGLSEFGEKYFETARDCLSMNLSFWVIDWMGQGKSDRYLKNPQKRHSREFDKDVADLHALIMGYIKHSSVHPDRGRIPLVMLAHSMGANIGLHYLSRHPGMFECAAMTAPMVGIKALENIPCAAAIAGAAAFFADKAYVPGGGNWTPEQRQQQGTGVFSHDPARAAVHNAWRLADPALQVGSVTWGWLYAAAKSCAALRRKNLLQTIQTHCLIALAGHEEIVSNTAIRAMAAELPNAKLIELPDSLHEILMEKDDIRKVFFNAFHEMIVERIIKRPETLKPF